MTGRAYCSQEVTKRGIESLWYKTTMTRHASSQNSVSVEDVALWWRCLELRTGTGVPVPVSPFVESSPYFFIADSSCQDLCKSRIVPDI